MGLMDSLDQYIELDVHSSGKFEKVSNQVNPLTPTTKVARCFGERLSSCAHHENEAAAEQTAAELESRYTGIPV